MVTTLRWPPVRCAARLLSLWGAVPREGRHLVCTGGPSARRHNAGHAGRLVGTATPLRERRRPGSVSRLSSPIPGPRESRVHTCRTLPRAGSVSASRNGLDRSCAHGRVHSDRAVDRPCSRLVRPQETASPHGGLARLSSQVSRHRALLVAFSLLDSKRYGSGGLRIRRWIRPGSASRTRGHTSGRPHPVPLANNVDVPLAAHFCTVAPFGQWEQTHCPYKFLAYMAGPCWNGSRPFRNRGSGLAGSL